MSNSYGIASRIGFSDYYSQGSVSYGNSMDDQWSCGGPRYRCMSTACSCNGRTTISYPCGAEEITEYTHDAYGNTVETKTSITQPEIAPTCMILVSQGLLMGILRCIWEFRIAVIYHSFYISEDDAAVYLGFSGVFLGILGMWRIISCK